MRPMMRLVLGLGALVAILIGVAFALPSHVTIYRSVVINAPEAVVFPYLNNLHRFVDWSPWAARDPQLRVTYAGPEEGKGARTEWTSEKRSVGTGSMEIASSDPNRHLDLVVNFNGMDGTSYYDVAPSGSGSKVTWGFGVDMGGNPFRRWKGLMLDGIVGTEYRDGLARLKERIEAARQPTAPAAPPTAGAPVPPSAAVVPPAGASSTAAEQPAGAAAPAEGPPLTASTPPPPAPAVVPKPQPSKKKH
jgi:polyketide cyclase/dehydrase/lipid transport protein